MGVWTGFFQILNPLVPSLTFELGSKIGFDSMYTLTHSPLPKIVWVQNFIKN